MIVVYMGVRNLPAIVAQLREAGLSSQTPIALVRWGTWSQQAILTGTLATICDRMAAAQFGVPAIAAIGNIVQLSEILPTLDPPQ
jgi:uroporphyrin-III C-methyltransferase